MIQVPLVAVPAPPLPALVELHRGCASELPALVRAAGAPADLVVADPPWNLYRERPGMAAPDGRYPVLTEDEIGAHVAGVAALLRPGGRLALWACWPLLVAALAAPGRPGWLDVPGVAWKTGGAWSKGGAPGVGYHWRGHSEPVLVGVRQGGAAGRAAAMLRSSAHTTPGEHSAKPAGWMAEWIRAWVPPGGLVVDPYAGTGAVAEAVLRAGRGRRYLGTEIDPTRHRKAIDRIAIRGTP